jgi:hypothetical protein
MKLEIWKMLAGALGFFSGGGFVAWLRVRAMNRKDDASSTELITRAATELIENYKKRVDALEVEVKELRYELRKISESKDAEILTLKTELHLERGVTAALRIENSELKSELRVLKAQDVSD